MKKILAKSSGVSLIEHSVLVSKIATEMAKQTLSNPNEKLIETIRLGGLLHDIGKCQASLQKKFKNDLYLDENIEYKVPYRHNEVGWAFLTRYTPIKDKDLLDAVYWHHGISNTMNSYCDVDIKISDTDIKTMSEYFNEVTNMTSEENAYQPKKSPVYYTDEEGYGSINSKRTFIRTCVISADRLASSLNKLDYSDSEITELVKSTSVTKKEIDISSHQYSDNDRFKLQQSIVTESEGSTVVKATAGFGKTLLGLLWSFRSDKKLIWVCPRNIVATSVYNIILEELDKFNNQTLSVELYLSGEVKKSNKPTSGFESDIIITNIDNYLKPTIENGSASKLLSIVNYDVIFDEYHELIGDTPLCACFVNLMRVRHQLTNSETLLLSATPTNIHKLWSGLTKPTKILPNVDEHYNAPHNKEYKINIIHDLNDVNHDRNNLFIFNSVVNTQINKTKLNCPILYHSRFVDDKKSEIISTIYENYGKSSDRVIGKPNTIGTHILQASLDISYTDLYDSVLSPESTFQRIGRINRWGDYELVPNINIININNGSENKTKEVLYSKNLSNNWYHYISNYDGELLTLNELYRIYNKFNKENENTLSRFITKKHFDSLQNLCKVYPIKFNSGRKKTDVKSSGGNKLRSTSNDSFVISKNFDNDGYCNPFSVRIYSDYTTDFNEESNTMGKILKVMKHLRNLDDDRFDYNDILNDKRITLDKIRKFGKKSNTPYIRFDNVYHKTYGLISKNNLNNIINGNK